MNLLNDQSNHPRHNHPEDIVSTCNFLLVHLWLEDSSTGHPLRRSPRNYRPECENVIYGPCKLGHASAGIIARTIKIAKVFDATWDGWLATNRRTLGGERIWVRPAVQNRLEFELEANFLFVRLTILLGHLNMSADRHGHYGGADESEGS